MLDIMFEETNKMDNYNYLITKETIENLIGKITFDVLYDITQSALEGKLTENSFWHTFFGWFKADHWVYGIIYFLLIIFFAYFYVHSSIIIIFWRKLEVHITF